ncbi:MAG: hypothetical protein ABI776_04715 [Nocardioidaceae bacterium]
MSSDAAVLDAIARSLAALRAPDLSGFDAMPVWRTMHELLTDPDAWKGLEDRVKAISSGTVRLEDADSAQFPFLTHELGARYVRLRGLFVEQLAVVGNSSPQFMFVPRG